MLAAAATWLENAKMATKEALVRVGVHSCVVRFDDKEALFSNIHAAFSDVGQVGAPNTKLLVQIKDQQWEASLLTCKKIRTFLIAVC